MERTSTIRLLYPQWQGGNVATILPELTPDEASTGYILGSELLNFLAPETKNKTVKVIAKGCICTTVAIRFCYLILFFLPYPYFPMQKWSKMLFNISSVMTSPVISSRASNDAFKSI